MPRFIKVTTWGGKCIYHVNVDKIISLYVNPKGKCNLIFGSGEEDVLPLDQSPSDVLARIDHL